MAAQPHEIELKFLVAPARAAGLTKALAGRAAVKTRTLTSTYFDTADRALKAHGMALRVRFDGERRVQTLKAGLVNGGIARGEWEAPVAGAAPDLAKLAETPAAKLLANGARLEPVFTVTVERQEWLRRHGGAQIEFAMDKGEAGEVGDAGHPAPICELELELKAGQTAQLLALAAKVRSEHALTPSFATKAERGFALVDRARARARKFDAPHLIAETTAGAAFRAIAKAALEQIAGNAERLRETPGPEVVHQMRVGARRLRSTLSTFKAVADDTRAPAIKAELRWLTGELDSARNLDVLLTGAYSRAARKKADTLGLRDLGRRLRIQRAAAYARARSAAESERLAAFLMDAIAWLECGPWTSERAAGAALRERPIGELAAEALERRRAKVARGGRRIARLGRQARHQLRIEAKKLRYAADAFAGLWGHRGRTRKFITALRRLQDRLGELNDIATAERLAHELVRGAADAGEADWAAGRLIGGEAAREAALIVAAADAHAALREAKRFWPKI
ncbi:MAG TPA: CHAD domain-containing protein [Caulobacteraceae bacterium]|nr:CHAD domain-containing protein [Caulobacteraceae bacterium]